MYRFAVVACVGLCCGEGEGRGRGGSLCILIMFVCAGCRTLTLCAQCCIYIYIIYYDIIYIYSSLGRSLLPLWYLPALT